MASRSGVRRIRLPAGRGPTRHPLPPHDRRTSGRGAALALGAADLARADAARGGRSGWRASPTPPRRPRADRPAARPLPPARRRTRLHGGRPEPAAPRRRRRRPDPARRPAPCHAVRRADGQPRRGRPPGRARTAPGPTSTATGASSRSRRPAPSPTPSRLLRPHVIVDAHNWDGGDHYNANCVEVTRARTLRWPARPRRCRRRASPVAGVRLHGRRHDLRPRRRPAPGPPLVRRSRASSPAWWRPTAATRATRPTSSAARASMSPSFTPLVRRYAEAAPQLDALEGYRPASVREARLFPARRPFLSGSPDWGRARGHSQNVAVALGRLPLRPGPVRPQTQP